MNATAGTRTRGSDVVKGVIVFGALGPPLGLLLLMIPSLVRGPSPDDALDVLRAVGWLLMFTPGAYVFGLLPAIASGVVAGLVRTMRPRWLAVLCTALAGAAASAALGAVIGNPDAITRLSAIGACSALLLALLFTRQAQGASPVGAAT